MVGEGMIIAESGEIESAAKTHPESALISALRSFGRFARIFPQLLRRAPTNTSDLAQLSAASFKVYEATPAASQTHDVALETKRLWRKARRGTVAGSPKRASAPCREQVVIHAREYATKARREDRGYCRT